MNAPELARIALWWSAVELMTAAAIGPGPALLFLVVWVLARADVYHPISAFRELADHYGLDPAHWLGYSRNIEGSRWLAVLLHPHQDGYHLVHHVFPTIPSFRARDVHRLLLQLPEYAQQHHCDGYFRGQHSLVRCWSHDLGSRRGPTGARASTSWTPASPGAPV
jgi:fatty acid desaturase